MNEKKNRNESLEDRKPDAVLMDEEPESCKTPVSAQSAGEQAAYQEVSREKEEVTVNPSANKAVMESSEAPETEKTPVEIVSENPEERYTSQEAESGGEPEKPDASGEVPEKSSAPEKREDPEQTRNPAAGKSPRKKKSPSAILGRLMMVLGVLLILSAILLYTMNEKEARSAAEASQELLPQVQEAITQRVETSEPTEPVHISPYDKQAIEQSMEMTEQVINGWRYIGFLSIPDLELELPVLSDWSDRKLQIAPCRHMGSTKSDDLVIAAHNYPNHFGRIKELHQGDEVEFVDMDGILSRYKVVTVNVIAPTAIEEVRAEELDLVLYTCTYGGQSRVMVGCQRIQED